MTLLHNTDEPDALLVTQMPDMKGTVEHGACVARFLNVEYSRGQEHKVPIPPQTSSTLQGLIQHSSLNHQILTYFANCSVPTDLLAFSVIC